MAAVSNVSVMLTTRANTKPQWASELALLGIRVAGLAPGMTATDMPRQAMSEKTLSEWVRRTPLKRMGLAQEIADGILFILGNDFFCGRVLEIDGGLRM